MPQDNQNITNAQIMSAIQDLNFKIEKKIDEMSYKLGEHVNNYNNLVLGKDTGNGLIQDIKDLKERITSLEEYKSNFMGKLVVVGVVFSVIIDYVIRKL
jgi:hypothetical protein